MSDSYTKLFSSITASTIVSEPLATRWLWVTMLAMSDSNGDVHGSIPGLARIANISLEDCEAALQRFLGPDPYSRTKDNEGRRVEEIDGGWKLLNHAKYRKVRSAEERREYMREYMRNRRAEEADDGESCKPDSKQVLAKSTEVTPPAPTPSPKKKEQRNGAAGASRFAEFWLAYPTKVAKPQCEAKWKAKRLDGIADQIITDVKERQSKDGRWTDGFVPNPMTYINQERWNDPIIPKRGKAVQASQDIDDLMGMGR